MKSFNNWTGSKEFTVTLKNDREVTSEVEVSIVRDKHHECDADGNRGRDATWVDEIIVLSDLLTDDSGEYRLTVLERNEIEESLKSQAEQYDWLDYISDFENDRNY